jgi:hypothetical protein
MGRLSYLAKPAAAAALLAALWGLEGMRVPRLLAGEQAQMGAVRILQFYASAGAVHPGQAAELCYGVENARSVWISPTLPDVYPSPRRCVSVIPDHTTHYTIMAEGFDGAVAVRSLTLAVASEPPPPSPVAYFALLLL